MLANINIKNKAIKGLIPLSLLTTTLPMKEVTAMAKLIIAKTKQVCQVEVCQNKHVAKGYCHKHYLQMRKYGKISRTVKDPNEIIIKDNIAEIVLYDKECKEIARTIIDVEDTEKIKKHKWCLSPKGYARTNLNGTSFGIQNIIMSFKPSKDCFIDHKDRNKLNNRKSNYRFCTNAENIRNSKQRINNTSGYKGVEKNGTGWAARITVNYKRFYLGTFKDKIDAVKAYNRACLKHHDEFACLNKI